MKRLSFRSFAAAALLPPTMTACSVSTLEPPMTPHEPETPVETMPPASSAPDAKSEAGNRERFGWRLAGSRPMDYVVSADPDPSEPTRWVRTIRYVGKEGPSGFGTVMQGFAAEDVRRASLPRVDVPSPDGR